MMENTRIQAERSEVRKQLLGKLAKLLRNPSSALFKGFVTCKLDHSFALNLEPPPLRKSAFHDHSERDEDRREEASVSTGAETEAGTRAWSDLHIPVAPTEIVPFSSDAEVLRLMGKYKDVQLDSTFVDPSHITIFLCFEERKRPFSVPNPAIFRKRCCGLWPFEVKQALGIVVAVSSVLNAMAD